MNTECTVIAATGMGTATADALVRSRTTQGVCLYAERALRTRARYAGLCACLTLVFASLSPNVKAQSNPAGPGSAATHAPYDRLLDEAVSAFDASEFSRARTLFDRAYRLRPNSRVLRGMGIAALRLERYSEAYRILTASLKHPVQPLTASQRDEVTGLLSWMETSLGCIKLRWTPSEPADYELRVDGNRLHESTLWLTAGTHHVAVHASGFGAIERSITLAPEQHEVIELTVQKREAPAVANRAPAPAVTPADAAQSLREPETAATARTKQTATPSSELRDSEPSDGGSVLTRWWFWTAVAAVAAGGVATAVLLSSPAPTKPLDTSEGGRIVTVGSRGSP